MLVGMWLALLCCMVVAAVDLPLPARIGTCTGLAISGIGAIRRAWLLRGHRAVRALCWSADGWRVYLGPAWIEKHVSLAPGSFRIGTVLVLWLRACDGTYGVCIDAGAQDPKALRRLCRRLRRAETAKLIPSVPKV